MDRLPMPSAMPAELAERQSDSGRTVSDQHLKELEGQAVENMVDRLIDGKTVNRVCSREIFRDMTDAYDKPQFQTILDLLDGVLSLNYKGGDERVLLLGELEEKAKELIHGYVLGRQDWINEEVEEILSEEQW